MTQTRPKPSTKDAKPRKCLGCGKVFPSKWRGNRICPRCTVMNERQSSAIAT